MKKIKSKEVEVITGFDGSCPHSTEGVRQDGRAVWTVFPNHRAMSGLGEEGAPGGGSRLSVRLRNQGGTAAEFTLIADWGTEKRIQHHDIGFIRNDDAAEWTMIPGFRDGAKIAYRLKLDPGVTHLGLCPEYNYSQCAAWVESMRGKGVAVGKAGCSRENRDIWLLQWKSPSKTAKNLLVHARDHAYETAGSYCVEGIGDFLNSECPISQYIRSKFNVWINPMTNPDGVHNGMSQRTWERGPRLDAAFRDQDEPDSAYDAIKNTINKLKPDVFLTMHNWTDKFGDGLLYGESEGIAQEIQRRMPDDTAHFKKWKAVQGSYQKLKEMRLTDFKKYHDTFIAPGGGKESDYIVSSLTKLSSMWTSYCEERFGTTALACEFPWFALNTEEMREKGKRFFQALALSVVEKENL